jgi:Permease for cytosine/purines, uracil, thiamine, allantoin
VLFSLVAGVTTIAAFKVYGEVMLHPEQISAKFDSWFLALLAAMTFAVATLGINVVANFVSPAFDFSNVFPRKISFKKGGYIAAGIALVLYPFAPWEGNAASFVGAIGATMGPLLGIILVDYYLVAKGEIQVEALYDENGAYRYQGGWNVSALIAAAIGALFSSILHERAAAVVGRLRLVLRRRDRRARVLAALDGDAAAGADGNGVGPAAAANPRHFLVAGALGKVVGDQVLAPRQRRVAVAASRLTEHARADAAQRDVDRTPDAALAGRHRLGHGVREASAVACGHSSASRARNAGSTAPNAPERRRA